MALVIARGVTPLLALHLASRLCFCELHIEMVGLNFHFYSNILIDQMLERFCFIPGFYTSYQNLFCRAR